MTASTLRGWASRALAYLVLVDVAFVFLLPVVYMLSTALKSPADLADPTVFWVPREPSWGNYRLAFEGLGFPSALPNSLLIGVPAAVGHVLAGSLAGYGFARLRFPGRDGLFLLVLFAFLVPPQVTVVPLFVLYKQLGWLDSALPFVVPAFLGHGLRGALFVLVFRQFFRGLPWELEDAASIDGAGPLRTYWQVMLPLARPAVLVVLLFSLVWHWNDYYGPAMFFFSPERFTLPMRLSVLAASLGAGVPGGDRYDEAVAMAATVLVVLPPLLLYLLAQRHFVEGVDRTGLVE